MERIRTCTTDDFDTIWAIINQGSEVYDGVIPADCYTNPYMSREELLHEIAAGVTFAGYEEFGTLVGVMGIQPVQDVTLIRHAYVLPDQQHRGIGTELLKHLQATAQTSVLIGTWAAATWAIRFYQRHGFVLVDEDTKRSLLRRYWTVPERQIETSVVLADKHWHL